MKYRFPNANCSDPEESRLGWLLNNFTSAHPDPIFIEQLRELGWVNRNEKTVQNKQELGRFIKAHGYKPNQKSKDSEEKRLGILYNVYTSESHPSFDPEITEKYKDVPTWKSNRTSQNKRDLDTFIKEHGYRPNRKSKDPEEVRLSNCLGRYLYQSSVCFDPEISEKYKESPTWQEYKRKKVLTINPSGDILPVGSQKEGAV